MRAITPRAGRPRAACLRGIHAGLWWHAAARLELCRCAHVYVVHAHVVCVGIGRGCAGSVTPAFLGCVVRLMPRHRCHRSVAQVFDVSGQVVDQVVPPSPRCVLLARGWGCVGRGVCWNQLWGSLTPLVCGLWRSLCTSLGWSADGSVLAATQASSAVVVLWSARSRKVQYLDTNIKALSAFAWSKRGAVVRGCWSL